MPKETILDWHYTKWTTPLQDQTGVTVVWGSELRQEGVWDHTLYVGWGPLGKQVAEASSHPKVQALLHRGGEAYWAWAEVTPDEARFVAYALAKRLNPDIPCPALWAASPTGKAEVAVNLPDFSDMLPLFNDLQATVSVGAPRITAHPSPYYPSPSPEQMFKDAYFGFSLAKTITGGIQGGAGWVKEWFE